MAEPPLTIEDAARELRAGTVSSVELTRAALARADEVDPLIAAYLTRFDASALARAEAADRELARGEDRGPLHGVPFAVKDILAMAEGPTTAQSVVLDPAWGAGKDGPVVRRLREAGAVLTGKTTTMEFAIGIGDPAKPFPVPRNPWDVERWPGGSSSGTASGIAAGLFYGGIGTDTGGSIRIPSAFCGVTGLLPTFGRVPKTGCVPVAWSLDRIGPLARTAGDCALVLEAIAGFDPSDESSSRRPVDGYRPGAREDLTGVRVGVMRELVEIEGADPALRGRFEDALAALEARGAVLRDVTVPYWSEVTIALLVALVSEPLAYHRNDLGPRWEDYYPGTRTSVALGALFSAADYVQAQRVRRVAQRKLAALFDEVDVIACPTAAVGAPRLDALDPKRLIDLAAYINTGYWAATGNPVLSMPIGHTATGGLPLAIQLAGRPFEEALLCRIGQAYQSGTDWHREVAQPRAAAGDGIAPSAPPAPDPSAPDAPASPHADAVRDRLAVAGLEPSPDDLASLIEQYPLYVAGVASLYEIPETRYESSAVVFDADPPLADWSEE
jgi:aspartyl-tRNA(Asn)/glutamyl-tRNA(Gln) amidotransferase subunit A